MLIEEKKAIEYFNKEAGEILKLLSPYKEQRIPGRPPKSVSHQITASIDEKEIEPRVKSLVDIEGKEISRYFFIKPGYWIGLDLINYKKFEKLINQLCKRKNIGRVISEKALKSISFSWLKERHCKSINESTTFIQYFESVLQKYVKEFKLSIPIDYLAIDDPFEVGKVKFEYLTKDLFDKIEMKLKEGIKMNKATPEDVQSATKKLRKKYQGSVVTTHIVTAEEEKAIELAVEETEKALSLLRFFSPSALYPKVKANFGRKGIANVPCDYVFIFENEIPRITERVAGEGRIGFATNQPILRRMFQLGLTKLSELLKTENITEFEELIFNAIYTFSKALSYLNFHEKLVFILSSAEIVFLKGNEPIQHSVGQRLGFFVFDDAQKRKGVVNLVKDAYEIRSKFLHHGHFSYDYHLLSELQLTIWKALRNMIFLTDKFKEKKDFIGYIEDIIYS